MAKKRRSAKQKRATRKLVALNRRRSSKPRKRRVSRKVKKRTTRRKSVARRTKRRSSGGKRSFIDKIPVLKNKTVQKIGFGLGMGALAGIILNFIPIPQLQANKALIQTGVTFAADPLAGVLRLTGLLGGESGLNIGNLLGGNSRNGGMNTGGFA